jgi:hypothetical protein
MKLIAFAVGAALASAALAQESKPAYASPAAEKLPLRVLYTGAADHPRTVDFAAFLGATFAKVGTVELSKLDAAAAKDYDVVIVDAPSSYPADPKAPPQSDAWPKAPKLEGWTKPTVALGAAGGALLTQQRLKLDWL